MSIVLTLPPELAAALGEYARRLGTTPEALAVDALRRRFLPPEPRDEWERKLFAIATDCGVSPPDSAFTSEELYD